jgi:hypothetical protein
LASSSTIRIAAFSWRAVMGSSSTDFSLCAFGLSAIQ